MPDRVWLWGGGGGGEGRAEVERGQRMAGCVLQSTSEGVYLYDLLRRDQHFCDNTQG